MSLIRLPIDIKSLYFNIKNDNKTGHTATVATPLKQGTSIHQELAQLIGIPENIAPISRERLISKILCQSRTQAKINRVYRFNHIAVNGVPLKIENDCAFCMYIREETDPKNIHCGRQKVHYPMSLAYEDIEVSIDNKRIIKTISDFLHGYAFLVEAFEYDTETRKLNFDVTIVGENNIPYSKVFINKRGVGNKFTPHFTESSDRYDTEIIALREKYGYDAITPKNFNEVVSKNDSIAFCLAKEHLDSIGAKDIRILSDDYPYSLYDLQCAVNNKRKYVIVKQTATKLKYFSLPLAKIQFCNNFADDSFLLLITDINGEPKIAYYTISDLNTLDKAINSITYEDRK